MLKFNGSEITYVRGMNNYTLDVLDVWKRLRPDHDRLATWATDDHDHVIFECMVGYIEHIRKDDVINAMRETQGGNI